MNRYDPLTAPVGVAIVDDHKFIAELLAHRLSNDQQINLIGIGNKATTGLALAQNKDVDIVMLDMELGEDDGIAVAREMLLVRPDIRIIGLSAHVECHYPVALLEVGGRGFLSKRTSATELIDGIRRVARGDLAISPDVAYHFATEMREPGPNNQLRALTGKEVDVLKLISLGHSIEEISVALNISEKTVRSHRASMKRKLKLTTDVELCLLALRAGVIRMQETVDRQGRESI